VKKLSKVIINFQHEYEQKPLRIVADAAVAMGGFGDGKLFPVIIVDAGDRPDLKELIRLHEHFNSGDVDVTWGKLPNSKDNVVVFLEFKRPVELVACIEFDLPERAIVVDQAVMARAFYLQTGKDGDRFVNTQDAPRILVEIPDTDFKPYWEEIFYTQIWKKMKKEGLGRSEAKRAARDYILRFREFGKMRV